MTVRAPVTAGGLRLSARSRRAVGIDLNVRGVAVASQGSEAMLACLFHPMILLGRLGDRERKAGEGSRSGIHKMKTRVPIVTDRCRWTNGHIAGNRVARDG